ncbi:hypothetical protein BGL52_04610 [Lacticaseibacillus casei]|uniref:Uncharacterized protein n=1 Tax=Lacticaseibacillus casei TaxID=1582 RepID=A0AAN1C7K2_LACCA|nr:hypothetical protein BGL52_04610 [Lacticaseibacillus casei]
MRCIGGLQLWLLYQAFAALTILTSVWPAKRAQFPKIGIHASHIIDIHKGRLHHDFSQTATF